MVARDKAYPVRHPIVLGCGSGFWGGQRPSLAHYVTGMGPMDGATAAGGRSCCLSSATLRLRWPRHLATLDDLLHRDVARANAFFRTHVAPIMCRPVKEAGRKFYRATVAANEGEIVKSLGLARAFDFGGCGGPQSLAGKQVTGVLVPGHDIRRRGIHRLCRQGGG
jgi:hypothetical protein